MSKKVIGITAGVVVIGAVVIGVSAGGGDSTEVAKVGADSGITAAAPEPEDNPLTTDGTWLVPSEVQPGDYRAVVEEDAFGNLGYVEVCADAACEIDMDGSNATGLIDNYAVQGSSIVHIPQGAFSVKITSADLKPLN